MGRVDDAAPTATAAIQVSLGTDPPTGVLTDGQGRDRRFRGWIELAAAIEDWRIAASTPPGECQSPASAAGS